MVHSLSNSDESTPLTFLHHIRLHSSSCCVSVDRRAVIAPETHRNCEAPQEAVIDVITWVVDEQNVACRERQCNLPKRARCHDCGDC